MTTNIANATMTTRIALADILALRAVTAVDLLAAIPRADLRDLFMTTIGVGMTGPIVTVITTGIVAETAMTIRIEEEMETETAMGIGVTDREMRGIVAPGTRPTHIDMTVTVTVIAIPAAADETIRTGPREMAFTPGCI